MIQAVASRQDLMVVMPMVMLTLFACGILVIDLLLAPEDKHWNALTAAIGLVFAGYSLWRVQGQVQLLGQPMPAFRGMVLMNQSAIYFFWLFLLATAITILVSVKYLEIEREDHGEYYSLMLFSVVGMMCMASGADIVLLFIGLELMAISTYILVGFLRRDRRSNEAALKYLLLGAFSSGIFAYGLSLMYGITGTTDLGTIGSRLSFASGRVSGPILVLMVVTTLAGLFFKIAAVPFHQWAPDAYEGAPTAITGFMSVASKAAAWALLLRIIIYALRPLVSIWMPLVIFVAVATLTGGNLAAITQNNLKRLLAYSSIAHVGYMLFGVVAWNETGIKGILLYLLVYTFMNLGAFAVIVSLRRREIIGDEIDDINGLYFKQPVEAVLMMVFLLSLAGIPPLAGFYGKYFIFLGLIQTGHYVLASLAVFYIAVSLYYYLRIINAMFMKPALDVEPVKPAWGLQLAVFITALGTIGIGLAPELFIRAVNWSLGIREVVNQAMVR